MTRATLTICALFMAGCAASPGTWPHNATPHTYQLADGEWRDMGATRK